MSSHLKQFKSHLPSQISRSCMNLPAIFPAPPRDFKESRFCCFSIPFLMSRFGNGHRNDARICKNKNRDANYWKRVYEYPYLNDQERLLAHLKGIDGLSWKDIVARFNEKMGLELRQPALQMRLTRLAFRMDRLWKEENLQKTKEMSFPKSQTSNPSHPTFDQKFTRDKSFFPQSVDTAAPNGPASNLGSFSEVNENPSYFLTIPSQAPHVNYLSYN